MRAHTINLLDWSTLVASKGERRRKKSKKKKTRRRRQEDEEDEEDEENVCAYTEREENEKDENLSDLKCDKQLATTRTHTQTSSLGI